MAQPSLLANLSQLLNRKIDDIDDLRGGCSYPAYRVSSGDLQFFVKTNDQDSDVLLVEADGLRSLQKHSPLVPELIFANKNFLVLEYIEPARPEKKFWQSLALQLGQMHAQKGPRFGAPQDNFIGLAPQKNHWNADMSWADFFWKFRIEFKLNQLKHKNQMQLSDAQLADLKILSDDLLAEPTSPSPLHGDLWSGNILCGKGQRPYLIDPAFYYGDREADLAMTECFGGFHADFYETYNREFPLPEAYSVRKHLYNLYHMLNHQVIFGAHYKSAVDSIVEQLLF